MREDVVFGVLDRTDGESQGGSGSRMLSCKGGSGKGLEPFDGLFWVPRSEEESERPFQSLSEMAPCRASARKTLNRDHTGLTLAISDKPSLYSVSADSPKALATTLFFP
jgi:hypothetical protein